MSDTTIDLRGNIMLKSVKMHYRLLAYLSRRLAGELIGYTWYRRRRPSSVHNFKRLLL